MVIVLENMCPVCGYRMGDESPSDFNICPSCGTEFGLHDVSSSILALRNNWMAAGPRWWSTTEPVPENWNPFIQLGELFDAEMESTSTTDPPPRYPVVAVVAPSTSEGPTYDRRPSRAYWACAF